MKIKILGTRGEIPVSAPYHSKQSGVLIDNQILFDIGEKEYLKYKPKHIFITHLHPDHAYFVRTKEIFDEKIYAPEKTELASNTTVLKKQITINSYKIKPIPTEHSRKVKSTAYLIQKGKQKILYTGDMIWINKEYHKWLKNLDLVITEASFVRKGGMVRRYETGEIYGHTGVPNLINLFKKFTKKIVLTHFGSWIYKDMKASRKLIKKMAEENNVEIIVGYDGMEIKI